MGSTLDELARIPAEIIHLINNFLSMDKNLHDESAEELEMMEEEPDTEEQIDMLRSDLSSDSETGPNVQKHCLNFKHSLITICPNLEVLAIAVAQKFVILERSKILAHFMEILAKVRVSEEKNVYITALSAFGVSPPSTNATSKSLTTDWSCICIGLNTGQLLFYTERGVLLFVEKCSTFPLLRIRLGPSAQPGNQELVVLTGDSRLLVVEGLSLYVALRTARTQIAHGERSEEELSTILQLNAHQLQLENISSVNDFEIDGLSKLASFDQYTGAYFAGGRTESVTRTHLPTYSHYICTVGPRGDRHTYQQSSGEFIAFFWHNTQPTSANFTDALFSITSKLSSNLPSFGVRSFLGVGTSRKHRPQKQWVADIPATRTYMKSSLRDGRRSERTFFGPYGWHLVALTDNTGRVLLIHTRTRRILRIWKGYRQARCAWVETESTMKMKGRGKVKTLFLVIFAPRRGLLEVWSIQNGPRISAFELSDDDGRLFSLPSAQIATLHGMEQACDVPQSASSSGAIFLSSDGSIYSINVPFHLSALDASTAFVHDENLIKQVCMFLSQEKSEEESPELMLDHIHKLKTAAGKISFLDSLLLDSTPKLMANFVSKLASRLEKPESTNDSLTNRTPSKHLSSSNLHQYVMKLDNAIKLYCKLDTVYQKSVEKRRSKFSEDVRADGDAFCSGWHFESEDTNVVKALEAHSLYQKFKSSKFPKIVGANLESRQRLTLREFVHNFNLSKNFGHKICSEDSAKVNLRNADETSQTFGATLFLPFLMNDETELCDSFSFDLPKAELIRLYLAFWLSPDWNPIPEEFASSSYRVLKDVVLIGSDGLQQIVDSLKLMEDALIQSTNTTAALILSLQINTLLQEQNRNPTLTEITADIDEKKEHFFMLDDKHFELQASVKDFWSLAALHLAALSLLELIFYQLNQSKPSMSLEMIAQRGAGFYGEQIGIALSRINNPAYDAKQILSLLAIDNANKKLDDLPEIEEDFTQVAIDMLRKIFPQSLLIERIECDCVWESASAWHKNGHSALHNLKLSIGLLDKLNSVPKMQHGLSMMIWDAFLGQTFERLFHLMEKQLGEKSFNRSSSGNFYPLVGTDWILKKDVLVAEADLPTYISCVRTFLHILADASCRIEGRRDIAYGPLLGALHVEDQVINTFMMLPKIKSYSRERELTTLFQLADRQKQANYHLILHHFHLAAVIELQVFLPFDSYYTKPSALFDPIGRRAFFTALNTHPLLPISRVDDRNRNRRQRFVENCAEALARFENTHQKMEGESRNEIFQLRHLLDTLVKDWHLDVTKLEIKEITRLYLCGQDQEAESHYSRLVGDNRKLAFELIPIIAARIKTLMGKDEDLLGKICKRSLASESTLTMIKDVPEEGIGSHVEVPNVRKMIALAKSCLFAKDKRLKPVSLTDLTDFSKCSMMLKEFDEICLLKIAD